MRLCYMQHVSYWPPFSNTNGVIFMSIVPPSRNKLFGLGSRRQDYPYCGLVLLYLVLHDLYFAMLNLLRLGDFACIFNNFFL